MSLIPDDQLSELRGRVAEVEARLSRLEAGQTLDAHPRFVPAPAPVASRAPAPVASDWPSVWASPAPASSSTTPSQGGQGERDQAVADLPRTLNVSNALGASTTATTASATKGLGASKAADGFAEPEGPGIPNGNTAFKAPDDAGHSLLDWETLIGGRLALWVGALCLFLALASLLVYVGQTLPPPTPAMRVASGLAASLAFFAGAFGARKRTQRWFVDGLLGAGLAVGVLSVWGGGPHFALWSIPVSVAGFSGLSALGMMLSARRDSRALLALSATGGFLTPILVQGNTPNRLAFAFLSFLLALNAGIVGVCVAKKWRDIAWGAFGATALLCLGWASGANIEAMRPMLWVFASLGWLLFAGAACFGALWRGEKFSQEDSALLFCASGLYAGASQWLLAPLLVRFPGAFSLGLTLLFGALWFVSRRRAPSDEVLRFSFLALACVAGALFVPLQLGERGLVWGWMAQAVGVSLVGRKSGLRLLQDAGATLWALALLALTLDAFAWPAGADGPFDSLSWRLAFCVGATARLLFDAPNDRSEAPLYATVLAWSGALWIGRAFWLGVAHSAFAPAHRGEAAILLGASATLLWSLGLWHAGWWRGQKQLRFNAALVLGSALCAIGGVGLWGQAPLVWVRVAAFSLGAFALWMVGVWHAHHEADDEGIARENTGLSVACWALLGGTIEVAAHFNSGVFGVPALGTSAWFALCASWSVLAALAGAWALRCAWPKLWTLGEGVFAVSTGVLLWQSLLVPHALEPLWNARLGAFTFAWMVALLARRVDVGEAQKRGSDWWLLAMLLLALWSSTQELWNGVETHHALWGHEWQRFASLGVSLLWSFYAILCLVGGVVWRAQNVRVGALGLGALAVCKVFLLDLSFLDGGLRVLSLGGLGLALLFISWLYGRLKRQEIGQTA